MGFNARANRKLIAIFLFSLMYADLYAGIHLSRNNRNLKARMNAGSYHAPRPLPVMNTLNPVATEKPTAATMPPSTGKRDKPAGGNKQPSISNKRRSPRIDGPGQPEMKTFRPAGLDNMVDLFSGDFSYSISLLDVGGYPINLFYSGGISMEQEASWVGLGWNINPGTISRNMRGLPDDFNGNKGDEIKKEMNVKNDLTVGVSINKAIELFGAPKLKKFTPTSNVSIGVNYNNYRGVGLELGFNPAVSLTKLNATENTKGTMDTSLVNGSLPGGVNLNLNSQSGLSVSPYINFNKLDKEAGIGARASVTYNSRVGLQSLQLSFSENREYSNPTQEQFIRAFLPGLSSSISFAKPSVTPGIRMPMNSFNANLSLRFGKGYKKGFLKGSPTIGGYLSISSLKDHYKTSKAFGYFHYTDATAEDALMDFNRINDIPYQEANPVMAFPVYTYDVFSISGEGTGGSFRGYRADIGYIKDQQVKTTNSSFSLGLAFNKEDAGDGFKVDVDFNPVISPTEIGAWRQNNLAKELLRFTSDKGTYQSVYFKNPAEKTIINRNYFEALGGDDMVRLKLVKMPAEGQLRPQLEVFNPVNKNQQGVLPVNSNSIRQVRDKRTQVITALTAQEAEIAGLNQKIEYYPLNVFPRGDCDPAKKSYERWDKHLPPASRILQGHHLSEFTALGGDGKRYVYGTPVQNIEQKDVSFNVTGNAVTADGLVNYSDQDASIENNKGNDHFYQKETIPAYAHSFLLTGLLSPDYVDLKGDGITEDDMGNAVKFNYTKVFYGDRDYIQWRMPFAATAGKANYSPGLLTDNSDDKAHYSFGKREQWYLNSIESKTMIATFELEARDDGKEAAAENGGVNPGAGSYRLKKIDLFSKVEYKTNGANARPITTVYFEYDYTLCPGVDNNTNGGGKLTLKRVRISGNGNNQRLNKNIYTFKYANNKPYNRQGNDRWGNYKNAANNPGSLPNDQYPFVAQQPSTPTDEVAPWQLNEIILPAGGKIKIAYEADDYGYVQNKRAAAMFTVAGFSDNANGSYSNRLYNNTGLDFQDNFYVYVKASQPLHANAAKAKQQIKEAYLADINQLYLKLYVKVPRDQFGSGYEPIGLYTDITDYGPAPDRNYFWIKVNGTSSKMSQIMDAVLQYAKDNLASKIYPGANTRNEGAVKGLAKALLGMGTEIVRTVGGFDNVVRKEKKFQEVETGKSFVRLSHPAVKKLGGGYRVKEVRILDQWDKMTQQYLSELGQVYEYTTTLKIADEEKTISSGVASYEPSIGGEENPFREVMRSRVNRILAKDQYLMQELPVGEMFFPSATVGYSKVRVSSIRKNNVKNGVSLQEATFYTTKDFPTLSSYTTFDPASKIRYRPDPFSRIMTHRTKRADNLSQGLLVSLNDMNGKMRSQATYAANDLKNPISYTENIYRIDKRTETQMKLNNRVTVVKGSDGKVYDNELIGKDVEVMVDFREHVSKTYTLNVTDFNLEVLKLAPIPIIIPVLLRGAYYDESIYRAASMTKIVNTYGILDSIISIDKGSMVSTKNLVYDGETGEVLINRTNNEFDKPIYNFNYPAHWAYSGMGPAYKNIQAVYSGIDFREGKIVAGNIDPNVFESGDELLIVNRSIIGVPAQTWECFMVEGAVNNLLPSKERIIWALDARKDPANGQKQFVFIDRDGNLFTGKNVTIKILRSGHRNFLGASVGKVVSRNSPIQLVNGVSSIVFNNQTAVLNAGVQEFKELWRTDTLLEQKDSLTKFTHSGNNTYHILQPQQAYSAYSKYGVNDVFDFYPITPGYYASHRTKYNNNLFKKRMEAFTEKSWLRFDLTSLPANGFITYSTLQLGAITTTSASNPAHYSAYPLTNRIYLQRMRHPWYTNTNDWKRVFRNQLIAGNYTIYEPTLLTNSGSLYGPGSRNAYMPITGMVRNMRKDQLNGVNYATGFKLSLRDDIFYWNGHDGMPLSWAKFKHLANDCNNTQSVPYGDPSVCTQLQVSCLTCPPTYNIDSVFSFKVGYVYFCSKIDAVQYCETIFNRKRTNPYTTALLNWRPHRSLVYYSNRMDSTVQQQVELSKGGVIANFAPWWQFNATGLTTSNAKQWVWNSEITQYNLKGAELENKDPLGRYNAGLYGYNDLLPIAVANNARYQELAYDGFEDYGFRTQDCEPFCKKGRRLKYNNGNGITIDNTVSHTGLSSLKLNAGGIAELQGAVKPVDQPDNYAIRVKMDSSSFTQTRVEGKGTGFQAKYYSSNNFTGTPYTTIDPSIAFNWPASSNTVQATAQSIKWDGWVQAAESGNHIFYLRFNGTVTFKINGAVVWSVTSNLTNQLINLNSLQTLTKGSIYHLEIDYKPHPFLSTSIKLWWSRYIAPAWVQTDIPASLVYPPGTESLAPSAVISQTWWCVKTDSIRPKGNFLIDGFNLIQGRKMWISAWVKEGSQDCKCSTYVGPSVQVYCDWAPQTVYMKASGTIIEGWQRFEGEFTVPANAGHYSIRFQNTGNNEAWFDDIRIQPFNSSMKTFVYHPGNLRLMAEMDENNYATFYEYDDEGILARVKRETARGVKTITETRTTLQRVIND